MWERTGRQAGRFRSVQRQVGERAPGRCVRSSYRRTERKVPGAALTFTPMRPRVLVLSDSEELLPELTKVLDHVGFETGCARVAELERDEVDLGVLLHGFDPQVVVLELALPYARSGAFLR